MVDINVIVPISTINYNLGQVLSNKDNYTLISHSEVNDLDGTEISYPVRKRIDDAVEYIDGDETKGTVKLSKFEVILVKVLTKQFANSINLTDRSIHSAGDKLIPDVIQELGTSMLRAVETNLLNTMYSAQTIENTVQIETEFDAKKYREAQTKSNTQENKTQARYFYCASDTYTALVTNTDYMKYMNMQLGNAVSVLGDIIVEYPAIQETAPDGEGDIYFKNILCKAGNLKTFYTQKPEIRTADLLSNDILSTKFAISADYGALIYDNESISFYLTKKTV